MVVNTSAILDSLDEYEDLSAWINDAISEEDPADLQDLHHHVTQLIDALDFACENTSNNVERIIDDVSRAVPRLTYDLHFMKDGAMTLQNSLVKVHDRSSAAIPQDTSRVLDQLKVLDTMKIHMEAAREVLREAESWSTLELEVTVLLSERNYAKAAARLSEASRSMVVFENTAEYDPRRALMVNLQNQLEASLSSALVAAINSQDLTACREYFAIFCNIQRESEFRNYYYGSRRASIITLWQEAQLLDCGSDAPSNSVTFAEFLHKFYAEFIALLNAERAVIPSIFPDPSGTLSSFISSVFGSLQPTFTQRLTALSNHYGDSALIEIISLFRLTEDFAQNVQRVVEKIKISTLPSEEPRSADSVPPILQSHNRRRSMRMSMSWRSGPQKVSETVTPTVDNELDWDQEVFQPFLAPQLDYAALERRFLDNGLREIITTDSRHISTDSDQARLLRERAVDVFDVAEKCLSRSGSFTYGYGSVGLVSALDGFLKSFLDMWTADVSMFSSENHIQSTADGDLSDLDYTSDDWAKFQQSIHLLSSARSVLDKLDVFEIKLRSNLGEIASKFRMARTDPVHFTITRFRGENTLLERSTLNSAELHILLERVDSASVTQGAQKNTLSHSSADSTEHLLLDTRASLFSFARACQISLQNTILSPLRQHLALYSTSALWSASGDPKAKRVTTVNDLQVPSFSLSPSDTVQRVADGLLNLPRLFEVYVDDDALSFSLHTLPYVDAETLKMVNESAPVVETSSTGAHMRRSSLSNFNKSASIDPEMVSSVWMSSLGRTILHYLTTAVLPKISFLGPAGAAQLHADIGYLSNIARALNVEFEELEKWKEYVGLDDEQGKRMIMQGDMDGPLKDVARMRGWIQH